MVAQIYERSAFGMYGWGGSDTNIEQNPVAYHSKSHLSEPIESVGISLNDLILIAMFIVNLFVSMEATQYLVDSIDQL